jgi:hypothetical protein
MAISRIATWSTQSGPAGRGSKSFSRTGVNAGSVASGYAPSSSLGGGRLCRRRRLCSPLCELCLRGGHQARACDPAPPDSSGSWTGSGVLVTKRLGHSVLAALRPGMHAQATGFGPITPEIRAPKSSAARIANNAPRRLVCLLDCHQQRGFDRHTR